MLTLFMQGKGSKMHCSFVILFYGKFLLIPLFNYTNFGEEVPAIDTPLGHRGKHNHFHTWHGHN